MRAIVVGGNGDEYVLEQPQQLDRATPGNRRAAAGQSEGGPEGNFKADVTTSILFYEETNS